MSWDGFQREVLAELGLRPYVLADAAPAAEDTQVARHEVASDAAVEHMSPKLIAALARAAGCAPAQVVALAGITSAPMNGAARRALWPRLRRLRSTTQ